MTRTYTTDALTSLGIATTPRRAIRRRLDKVCADLPRGVSLLVSADGWGIAPEVEPEPSGDGIAAALDTLVRELRR